MYSVLCICTSRGEIVITENYKNDVSHEELENLISTIVTQKQGSLTPCIKQDDLFAHYIIRGNLIYLIIGKRMVSGLVAVQFLDSFHQVLKNFCGSATEDAINKNLILVHELMTECIECGYIQTTNIEKLRSAIFSDPIATASNGKHDVKKPGPFGLEKVTVPGSAADRPLVKSRSQQNFRQSEVFIDVIEKLVVHMGKDGTVKLFCLNGSIQMKSFIAVSHSILICLNNDLHLGGDQAYVSGVHLDHHFFHENVDAQNFEEKHTFTVSPTQGEITVMNYLIESAVPAQLPFRLVSAIEESTNTKDIDFILKVCCNIPGKAEVLNLLVNIPISSATKSIMQQFNMPDSTAEFIKKERKILWKIRNICGKCEAVAKFKLVDAMQCSANRLEFGPVVLEFEASNFVCSGLSIKNLKAEDPTSKSIPVQKWVRYVTLADSYLFKLQQFIT